MKAILAIMISVISGIFPIADNLKQAALPQDYELICNTVMAEAGAECYEGQCAVAQCIYNAIEREGMPFSSIYRQYGYNSQKTASSSVKQAVKEVFCYGYRVTPAKIIVYYNPSACTSAWHESQIYVCTIGNHRFFEMRY